MNVLVVCPAPAGTLHGNRVTALRWARMLRAIGCRVTIAERFRGENAAVLVALHARRSAPSVEAFRRAHPERPVVVALTGTDIYRDLGRSGRTRRVLDIADRIVVLQALAPRALAPEVRAKARVIHQSVAPSTRSHRRSRRRFDVLVVAHLRAVKDPLRAALAARQLPSRSRVSITHFGKAMTRSFRRRALAETAKNPRYRWAGERPRREVLRRLRRADLLALTSLAEGGANVVSEAVVSGTPIVASRIAGSVGLLGADYPGYFKPGDTRSLARLLMRAEGDRAFYARLAGYCRRVAPLFHPAREQAAWRRLLSEITPNGGAPRRPKRRGGPTSNRRRRDRAGSPSRPRR